MDRNELEMKFDKGTQFIQKHDLSSRQDLFQNLEDFFDTSRYDMKDREDVRRCIRNRAVTYASRGLSTRTYNAAVFLMLELSLYLCTGLSDRAKAYRSAFKMTAGLLKKSGVKYLRKRHEGDEVFMKIMEDYSREFSLEDYGMYLDIMIFYCVRTGGITDKEFETIRKESIKSLEPVFTQKEEKAGDNEEKEDPSDAWYKALEDPGNVAQELKKYVMGQDEACEYIALDIATLFRYKRAGEDLPSPMVRLLIGETSSGKTFLMQTLQKLRVPVFFIDGSELTEAGYKGTNLDNALSRIQFSSEKYPVIFIDEFDSKLKPSYGAMGVDNNRPVQKNMLSLCAGTYPGLENALIYLAGAFSDLFRAKRSVAARYHTPQKKDMTVTRQDLLRYGMMNELLSRIKILQLNPVDPAMVRKILFSKESSPLTAGITKANMFGIDLSFSKGYTEELLNDVWSDDPGISGIRNLLTRVEEKVDAAILKALGQNLHKIMIMSREEEITGIYLESFLDEWR